MAVNFSEDKKNIHPTALVSPGARLGENVEVGPYAIVEEGASIGDNTQIMAHAFISRHTILGKNCLIHIGAVLGTDPQDKKFSSATETKLIVGDGNIIREYVTFHRASKEGEATKIGDNNLFMAQSHVGHDCQVGNDNIVANNAMIAGHVHMGDSIFVSGGVPIHQFVRIGHFAMLSGWTAVSQDVPPFMIAQGPNTVRALNIVGLTRAGLSKETIASLRQAHRILYRSNLSVYEALEALEKEEDPTGHVKVLIDFIKSSTRGICKPHNQARKV